MINEKLLEKRFRKGRCNHCPYGKAEGVSANGGFNFIGCYAEPYKGKFVAEIKECPIDGTTENDYKQVRGDTDDIKRSNKNTHRF